MEEKSLNKEIDDYLIRIMELEQKWLREQNELVRLIKDHQKKSIDFKNQSKKFVDLPKKTDINKLKSMT